MTIIAPEHVVGFRHERHVHAANRERGCHCGCSWVEGLDGALRHDSDTPKLIKLGMAIYDFPATEFHGPRSICYYLDELEGGES